MIAPASFDNGAFLPETHSHLKIGSASSRYAQEPIPALRGLLAEKDEAEIFQISDLTADRHH